MKRYIKASDTKIYYFIDPNGNLYKSYDSGFTSYTKDWNYDNDTYSMSVKYIYPLNPEGSNIQWVREDDWNSYGFTSISADKVKQLLREKLESYFIEGECKGEYYYCDSTCGGKYHYGDYSFSRGGPCVYGTPEDRENAIQTEIEKAMK